MGYIEIHIKIRISSPTCDRAWIPPNPRDTCPACIPHVFRMYPACILITSEDKCISHVSRMYPACLLHIRYISLWGQLRRGGPRARGPRARAPRAPPPAVKHTNAHTLTLSGPPSTRLEGLCCPQAPTTPMPPTPHACPKLLDCRQIFRIRRIGSLIGCLEEG
jgi:hypothetical protein